MAEVSPEQVKLEKELLNLVCTITELDKDLNTFEGIWQKQYTNKISNKTQKHEYKHPSKQPYSPYNN